MKLRISRFGRSTSLLIGIVMVSLLCVFAVNTVLAARASYVPNQYIIQATTGASASAVEQSVALMGGALAGTLPLDDTYVVTIGASKGTSTGGVLRKAMGRSVSSAAWVVKSFHPNYRKYATVEPNDEFWSKLWGMKSINMPQAWNVQKGSSSVTVAVIDSGVAEHPDLYGRLVPGYDYIDNDTDPSNDDISHGTHCAGIIAAQGDNDTGVCGVCWDGVQIMPLRILSATAPNSGATDIEVLALEYALQHGADVVNMSFGFEDPTITDVIERAQIQKLASAGIILCASAGNGGLSSNPGVTAPAKYDECIAVAAVGKSDAIAYYSSYGPNYEVDIAAPGGDLSDGLDGGILSTVVNWDGTTPIYDYESWQGTSMACPHVAGAVALLLSEGVSASEVRTRLEAGARKPNSGSLNKKKYGAGILDVNAALANGSVQLTKPIKGSTVNSYPDIKASIRGINPASIAIYIDYADGDGDGIPDNVDIETPIISGTAASAYLNTTNTVISFNYADVSSEPIESGFHYIYITATTTVGDEDVHDWGTFTVASKIIPAGMYLYTLPYSVTSSEPDGTTYVNALPSDIIVDAATSDPIDFRTTSANRARLIRWNAAQSYYMQYLTGSNSSYPGENVPKDTDRSWLNPIINITMSESYSDYGTTRGVPTAGGFLTNDASRALQFPAGTGFWLSLQKDAAICTDNTNVSEISDTGGFSIYLYKGWNLIGNPYTRDASLSNVYLTYQGQTRSFAQDQQSKKPWLYGDQIYSYSSDTGLYVRMDKSGLTFKPYNGYWVRSSVGGLSLFNSLIMTIQ